MQANNRLILGGALAAAVIVVGALVLMPRPTSQQPGGAPPPPSSAESAARDHGAPSEGPFSIADGDPSGRRTSATPSPTTPTLTGEPGRAEQPGEADGGEAEVAGAGGGGATSGDPGASGGAPGEVTGEESGEGEDQQRPAGFAQAGARGAPPAAPLDAGTNYSATPGRLGTGNPGEGVTPIPTPTPSRNDDDSPNATPTPSATPRPTPTPSPTPNIGRASIYLDPAAVTVVEGDYFTLDLYVNSAEKPIAGYTTLVLYVPIEVEVAQVREGSDRFLGYPMVARNDPRSGTLVLAAMQGSSLTEPIGELHVLSIDFEAMAPGTVQVNLVDSDVANTDAQEMILVRESGATITVEPLAAPE